MAPLDGGIPTVLADKQVNPIAIAADNEAVYYIRGYLGVDQGLIKVAK